MKLAQKITFLSVTLLVLYVTVMAGTKTTQAGTVGHGARIISYGDEGQGAQKLLFTTVIREFMILVSYRSMLI